MPEEKEVLLYTYPYGPSGAEIREYVDLEPASAEALRRILQPFTGDWPAVLFQYLAELEFRWVHDIEFVAPTDRTLSFAQLLPPGFRFLRLPDALEDYRLSVLSSPKILAYGSFRLGNISFRASRQDIRAEKRAVFASPGAMLIFLHEVGHTWQEVSETGEAEVSRLRCLKRAPAVGSDDWYGLASLALQEERDAWAYALWALRELRVMGVDVEPELPTPTDVFGYMHRRLETYEWELRTQTERISRCAHFLRQGDSRAIVRGSIRPRRLARAGKQ